MVAITRIAILVLTFGLVQQVRADELGGLISLPVPNGFEAIYRDVPGSDASIPTRSWVYASNGVSLSINIMDMRQQLAKLQNESKVEIAEIEAALERQCQIGHEARKSTIQTGPVSETIGGLSATLRTSTFVVDGKNVVDHNYCLVRHGRIVLMSVIGAESQAFEINQAVESIRNLRLLDGR